MALAGTIGGGGQDMVMALNFHVRGAAARSIKLDLDPARPNEKTILGFVSAGNFYEPDVARLLVQVPREGDTAIDVGANVGFFTVLAAELVGGGGRVVAVEPDPGNRGRLARNLKLNGFSQVSVIEAPVSDKAGPVDFFINSDNSGGSALWDPAQFLGNVRS